VVGDGTDQFARRPPALPPRDVAAGGGNRSDVAGDAAARGPAAEHHPRVLLSARQFDGRDDPFTLGVAAGAPRPDGFVLWTRLAPLSEMPLGGDREVGYEIAEEPAFRRVAQRGLARAEAAFAHAVHLEARGLQQGRPYWYRFFLGPWASATGRATTAPEPGSTVGTLRVGSCSCANYQHGYFAAYRHLAEEEPDLVLFLGDYIYESVDRSCSASMPPPAASSPGTTTRCRTTMPAPGRKT
jgi:phosphodiesterase/alkaline phosphatase D-like protein